MVPQNNTQDCKTEKDKIWVNYEVIYARILEQFPKFHSKFWKGKDDVRYYNEVLNELDIENQRPNTYPRVADKVLLILAVLVSLYNSGPNPDIGVYGLISIFSFLFIFYFELGEAYHIHNGNRSPYEVQQYYEYLSSLSSKNPSTHYEEQEYHNLSLRVFALDNGQCVVDMSVLLIDILVNVILIVVSLLTLRIRTENGVKSQYLDAFFQMFVCGFSIGFSTLYIVISLDNWRQLQKLKAQLFLMDGQIRNKP